MDLIRYLDLLDKQLLLFLNGYHSPFWDEFMIIVTGRFTWIPLYLLIIALIIKIEKRSAIAIILSIIVTVIAADLFASSLLKPTFERLRPCHTEELKDLLNMPAKCGGRYGFISSHAANTFALATFLFLMYRKRYKHIRLFFIWAAVVSYSRIYLGVHYPGDILAGTISGIVWANVFFSIYMRTNKRLNVVLTADSGVS